MKNFIKKPIGIIMTIILIANMFVAAPFSRITVSAAGTEAATGLSYDNYGNGVMITGFAAPEDFDGNLVIPETLGGKKVLFINHHAFYNSSDRASITSVTFPNSLQNIGGEAFRMCTGLTSVEIPNSVTTMEGSVFYQCSNLVSVSLSSNITTLNPYMFEGCTSLTSIDIPEGVTSIGLHAFYLCRNLQVVRIPETVTSIEERTDDTYGVFMHCHSSLTIHGYAGSYAETFATNVIKRPFVEISDYTCSTANGSTTITKYNGLRREVTIPAELDSCPVRILANDAFRDNKYITNVTIPNGVTSIGDYAFNGCTSLKSVTFLNPNPAGTGAVGTNTVSIASNAFNECSNVTFYGYTGSAAETFYSDRVNHSNITSFVALDGEGGDFKFNNFVDDGDTHTCTIAGFADGFTVPSNFPLVIPSQTRKWDSTNSKWVYYNVTAIGGYAFDADTTYGNTMNANITSVTIPDIITSIGNSAFRSVTISSVTIPNSVSTLGSSFVGCLILSSVTFEEGSALSSIGSYCFCSTALRSVTIPATVTSIGTSAFQSCTRLASATFAGTPSITTIGDSCFKSCTALTSITIPSTVNSIGDNAFNDCTNLATAAIYNSEASIAENANVFPKNTIIRGYLTSTAQTWASTYDRRFVPFDYGIKYEYLEYDEEKAGTRVYDAGIEGKEIGEYTTKRTLMISDEDIDDSENVEAVIAANAPVITNNYYDYSTNPKVFTLDENGNVVVTLTQTAKEYELYLNDSTTPFGNRTYHYQSKINVKNTDAGAADADTVLQWKDEDNNLMNVGTQFNIYITKDTRIRTVANNTLNPSGTSTITNSGYELKYKDGVHRLTREFYVQDFYYWSAMGAGSTFIGDGTIFKSMGTGDNETLTKDEVTAILKRDEKTDNANRVLNDDGIIQNANTYRSTAKGTSGSKTWSYNYIPATETNKLVYSKALRAYHYIQGITFTNDSGNASKKLRVYSYYVYHKEGDPDGKVTVVVSSQPADGAMYEDD